MPSLDFTIEKDNFRNYYSDNYELLKGAEEFVRSFITALLAQVTGLEKPTVLSRLKDREESIRKFSRKYQTALEEAKQPYEIRNYITDLIGIRVICLYENEIEKVVEILRSNFRILEESDKIKKIETTEGTFGYKGFHVDVAMNELRENLPEYRRFSELRYEVQVRTIIQDAWSVLDHKIKYKKSIPANLKRRINTLAALFELADHEFLSVRDRTIDLLEKAESTVEAKIEGMTTVSATMTPLDVPPTPLDVFSFLKIAAKHFPGYDFHNFPADSFVQVMLGAATLSADDLENILTNNLPRVRDYCDHSPYTLNPYTQIRHALYLNDRNAFRTILFERQRTNFEGWIRTIS